MASNANAPDVSSPTQKATEGTPSEPGQRGEDGTVAADAAAAAAAQGIADSTASLQGMYVMSYIF